MRTIFPSGRFARATTVAALTISSAQVHAQTPPQSRVQTVKVTPLGGVSGEFCPQNLALLFEEPNGTRIL